MRKGLTLIELLVALALFGALSLALVGALLTAFRTNQASGLEARATALAKAYLERVPREANYDRETLSLPPLALPQGFQGEVAAGGRMGLGEALGFSPCPGECQVACGGRPCRFIAVRLTLRQGERAWEFFREWAPGGGP